MVHHMGEHTQLWISEEFHQKYYVSAKMFAILANLAWKMETLTPE